MTQPDLEETPPPFTERLNKTICFFWFVLNGLLMAAACYFVHSGRPFPETKITYWEDLRTIFLILQLGYVVIWSVIATLTYLISGKLLNPLVERTFSFGVVFGLMALFLTLGGQ